MENLKNKLKKADGFTLVELLVVIAIIAILSVTAYVALGGQTGKARDSRRQSDLSAIQSALEIYFINNNSTYPATAGLEAALVPKLMSNLPLDPSTDANYAYAQSAKTYQLGATLEGDDGTYSAYVVGNGTDLLTGVDVPTTAGCSGSAPTDGSTTCVPMDIWN